MKLKIYADIIKGHDIAGSAAAAELAEDGLIHYLNTMPEGATFSDLSAFDMPDLVRLASAAATARAMVEVALALREVADGPQ